MDTSYGTYGTQPYSYTCAYPTVWATYENTVANAKANVSVAYAYTNNATTQLSSTKPTLTRRFYDNISTSTFATNYGDLVVGTGTSNGKYWLSSRYVFPFSSSTCYFGLLYVSSSQLNGDIQYDSERGSDDPGWNFLALRPLVSIPLDNVVITEEANGTFTLLPNE